MFTCVIYTKDDQLQKSYVVQQRSIATNMDIFKS